MILGGGVSCRLCTARRELSGTLAGIDDLPPATKALIATLGQHLKRNEFDAAVRIWHQLARDIEEERDIIRPLKSELYNRLNEYAELSLGKSELRVASDAFNLLVDLDPGRYEGHFGKAMVFKEEGKLDYATAFLTTAILAAPDAAKLFYHRAIIRSRTGDEEGALRDLNMAIEHNPRDASSYFNRSLLMKKLGMRELARNDMHIAQRLNPELKKNKRLKPRVAT